MPATEEEWIRVAREFEPSDQRTFGPTNLRNNEPSEQKTFGTAAWHRIALPEFCLHNIVNWAEFEDRVILCMITSDMFFVVVEVQAAQNSEKPISRHDCGEERG